jgi:hypothetical protein
MCVSLKLKIRSLRLHANHRVHQNNLIFIWRVGPLTRYNLLYFRNSPTGGNPPPVWNRKLTQDLQLKLLQNGWSWKLNFILIAWIWVKELTWGKQTTKAENRIKWCYNLRSLLISSLILLHCPQKQDIRCTATPMLLYLSEYTSYRNVNQVKITLI